MKKKLLPIVLTALFVSAGMFAVTSAYAVGEEKMNFKDSGGGSSGRVDYTCRCTDKAPSQCASNGKGSVCAPNGTAKCWNYNRNCQ